MSWVSNDDRFDFSLISTSRVCLFGMQFSASTHDMCMNVEC